MHNAHAETHYSHNDYPEQLETHDRALLWRISNCQALILSNLLDSEELKIVTQCKKQYEHLFETLGVFHDRKEPFTLEANRFVRNHYIKIEIQFTALFAGIRKRHQNIRFFVSPSISRTHQARLGHENQTIQAVSQDESIYQNPNLSIPQEKPIRQNPTISPLEQRERIKRIQNEIFGKNGEILSDTIVQKKRAKLMQVLDGNHEIKQIYLDDLLAASNESFTNQKLDNSTILKAIQLAKSKKDGALIYAIQKNLQTTAANDQVYDPKIESSTSLADHIHNISPENPIILNTVEYPIFHITSLKTVEFWETSYYDACVTLENGIQKHFIMNMSGCAVGDLSDKIVGECTSTGEIIGKKMPCTIRSIQSVKLERKSDRFMDFIQQASTFYSNIKEKFLRSIKIGLAKMNN